VSVEHVLSKMKEVETGGLRWRFAL